MITKPTPEMNPRSNGRLNTESKKPNLKTPAASAIAPVIAVIVALVIHQRQHTWVAAGSYRKPCVLKIAPFPSIVIKRRIMVRIHHPYRIPHQQAPRSL
jgi:hypothetical protein